MQGAKLCRYSRQTTTSVVLFALFFISWVILRMLYFPLFIIRRWALRLGFQAGREG